MFYSENIYLVKIVGYSHILKHNFTTMNILNNKFVQKTVYFYLINCARKNSFVYALVQSPILIQSAYQIQTNDVYIIGRLPLK